MPVARFATMTCPIGVAGIPGKEPAAIAIAVAAEMLQVRARAGAARRVGAMSSA
jgi:xanthine/CO dehydrogenase XdhC/CoxF family maturation factor